MVLSLRRLGKGGLVAAGVFVAFGVVTDLLATPLYVRMVPRTPLDYAFLAATSLLAGVYVVQRDMLDEVSGDACAVGGTVGGFLAFGCPVCTKLLLALFSSSAIMTYFDPLRPLLGVASVGLFGGVVVYRQRRYEQLVDGADGVERADGIEQADGVERADGGKRVDTTTE